MKNSTILISLVLIILLAGGFIFMNSNNSITDTETPSGNVIADGETQKVVISMKNGNYYPNTITVKEGQPVEITLDNSVKGCFRSFNIKDLGVSKYAQTPNDKILFTPDKKGTFTFACSMGMGYGKIIVE